jgi:AcrR family transcriptional regulator
MQRDEKSERSRARILDAALDLFSTKGFGATSVREIAAAAEVSVGAVYHHFPDKQSMFTELLDEYSELVSTRRFPFARALETSSFPDNIEHLGYAARDSVRQFRRHIALVYVDMIEFEGTHMRNFYSGLASRLEQFLATTPDGPNVPSRLRPGIAPASALMMVWRMYFNYFTLEILFGVAEPFGQDTNAVVKEIADVFRKGFCAEAHTES